MNRAGALAVGGVLAFALGLATLAVPGLLVLGAEGAVVAVVGLLALVQLVRILLARRRTPLRRAETADPELPTVAEPPGEDLGALLDQFDSGQYRYGQGNRRKSQLERVAVGALTRYLNYTESEARERIELGTWTDDPVAAAFLGGEEVGSLPVRSRIRARLAGESPYRRGMRRTIAEISAITGLPSGPVDDESTGSRPGLGRLRRRFGGRVETGDPPPEWDDQRDSKERPTGHWRGVSAAALAGIAGGVLAEQAAVLLVGVVGIAYAAYARSGYPDPVLSVERSVSPGRPSPDETVEVTVTVTNEGERVLPDVRFVDGVPPAVSVVDGSPRLGTTLRAGATASFSYTVDVGRGVHEFDPVHVVARNLSGTVEHERTVSADETTEIACIPPLQAVGTDVPVRRQPTGLTGRVDTSIGGEGTEFFSTRTYRPGDPMNRIDWNRHARTGELATLQFREERAVNVVLLVDATSSAAIGPDPQGPDAVDRSIDAASQAFTTLLDDGNQVGITALAAGDCWIPPGAGEVHRTRVRERLATDPALAPGVRSRSSLPYRWLSRLRSRMPGDAQVVLFSPLCSETTARVATRLDAYGYPVTVVSPDPTIQRTSGNRLSAVARRFRISDLRAADVPVVDWAWDDPLAVALARSTRRWSQ